MERVMTADPLPRCPHGNEAVIREYRKYRSKRDPTRIGTEWCSCEVAAPTEDRARRAWVALCSAD